MPTTLTLPDELLQQVKPYESQLQEILELGIRELRAQPSTGFNGVTDVLEKLATLPSPEEVLALRPAPSLQEHIDFLLDKTRTTGLSAAEQRDWDRYQYLEHLMRLAKASAARKLKQPQTP